MELLVSNKFKYIQKNNSELQFNEMPEVCQRFDEIYENLFYDISYKYSELKQYTDKLKELENEKLALFGVNANMNNFLCSLKIFGKNEEFIIIDNFENGFYEKKKILKPDKELFKDRKIIVFAENKFEEIEKYIQGMGLNCVNH